MGNAITYPKEYISSVMPTCCGGTAPIPDINTELKNQYSSTCSIKSKSKSMSHSSSRNRNKRIHNQKYKDKHTQMYNKSYPSPTLSNSTRTSPKIPYSKLHEIKQLTVQTGTKSMYINKYNISANKGTGTKTTATPDRSSNASSTLTYYHGYTTGSTIAESPIPIPQYHTTITPATSMYSLRKQASVTSIAPKRQSVNFNIDHNHQNVPHQSPPLWSISASIPEIYRDDASLILHQLRREKERASGEHWLDRYEFDSVHVRNDFDNQWNISSIIRVNSDSVCILNNNNHEYEWFDKRSSKLRPHPNYAAPGLVKNCQSHQIQLQLPPILPCHPDKILYHFDKKHRKDYIICCTDYTTFSSEYQAGVYKYDLNYETIEYLGQYPIPPRNYFKAIMDHQNELLHIYCFPYWSILNVNTGAWSVTSMEEAVKYNVMNIQVTSGVVADGCLYIFGNGRFAKFSASFLCVICINVILILKIFLFEYDNVYRFDRELMRFHEVGFVGIDHQIIWEVNDVIYMEKERRIYIFGMCDSGPSFHRMWYSDIYYINIDDEQLKWRKLKMRLPYYTYGVFADYSLLWGMIIFYLCFIMN